MHTSNTEQSDQTIEDILLNLVNEVSSIRAGKTFTPTDYTEPAVVALEHLFELEVDKAVTNARSKDPHTCEYGHQVYSHNTADGWCCACEADIAFLEAEIEKRVEAQLNPPNQPKRSQEELLEFVKDPETIKRAVEGSLDKRNELLNRDNNTEGENHGK